MFQSNQKPANQEMLRRSPRLLAKGYYNPEDPTIQQICSKETPIRIFKKREGNCGVGGACRNLISEFNVCDFQSLEKKDPMLTSEISPQHASPPSRCFLVVRKMVLLPLLLCLLAFGVWFCYTSVTKQLFQSAAYLAQDTFIQNQAALIEEFKFLKLTIRQQSLEQKEEFQKLAIRQQRLEQKDGEEFIRRALSHFRADGIGMADYALESLGAAVIASTETDKSKYCKLFGFSEWCNINSPEKAIQPEVFPGKCWGFKGSEGYLLISLPFSVRITHVTLEHLPRVLSPNGHTRSAPRDFAVYGKVNKKDGGKLLGEFTYDQDGEPIQTFEIPNSPSEAYELVELRILSNWGHPEYTCVYRFRVHSQPVW
ncbi:SUN domain-containing protein 2 isoform X1 [Ictalurus punctatus]|uniref:SUN domain-containing protein 2 isoform X1 n=2 Tax=Ictalurus punctatus TaxID=7998 RepID=A0A9F7RBZ5_ICTPU|nr:SUN domain-containing protein 2 isoform X1 [Ictalurus punctatus]